ncbi:MAG: hypothetical protein AMXMBFR58_36700 [Phycisphaerae bacterium]
MTVNDIASLLTTSQLAHVLGRSPATIVSWAKSGRIPVAMWVGLDVRGARYRLDDVLAALQQPPPSICTQAASDDHNDRVGGVRAAR